MINQSRKQLVFFLCSVFFLSYTTEYLIIKRGGASSDDTFLILILMWIPGLIALLMRHLWRRNLPAYGWEIPKFRWFGVAYLIPLLVALIAYGAAWITGLSPLNIPWAKLFPKIGNGTVGLISYIGIKATFGILIGSIAALGEEIGWRGLLVPCLIRAKIPAPLAISGFIWGVWHLPLLLWGGYVTSDIPTISTAIFILATIVDGITYGWIRLRSRSLWPAVLFHASHNIFFQSVFETFTGESRYSKWILGEAGVFPLIVYGSFALWLLTSGKIHEAIIEAKV